MKTNKTHFRKFERYCKGWIDNFRIVGWEINIIHRQSGSDRAYTVVSSPSDRIAVIGLSEDWGGVEPTEEQLNRCAFHEVCELFLSRYDHAAQSRFCEKRELNETRHEIIRTLENLLL